MIVRKLALVAMFTFLHDAIIRLYCMILFLTLSLVHHLTHLPYKANVLNQLETSFLTLLVLFGTINNFWAAQYSGVPAAKVFF